MMKAEVRIELPEDIRFPELEEWIDRNCETLATEVANGARASAAFADKTGKLRASIKAQKSKYEGGGWIVKASAPHAHLVEFGHALVRKGRVVGNVPAHPFLRPALDRVLSRAVALFRGAA